MSMRQRGGPLTRWIDLVNNDTLQLHADNEKAIAPI